MSTLETSYDTIPYSIKSFKKTNPMNLEAIATILGMEPTPANKCRVLEIGCASGGNIVPMAEQLPESEFVGIDLSEVQIGNAQKLIDAAGLTNISVKHLDILDFGSDQGEFDYIIAHGIYSWIPDNVKDKLLSICKEHLTPNGIAFVSYNTLPGWNFKKSLREMMLFHTEQFANEKDKIKQAKALTKFLADSVSAQDTSYSKFLGGELELIKKVEDAYIYHEFLEEFNDPCYFHQFAEKVYNSGLQYLGDVSLGTMLTQMLGKELYDTLEKISSNIIAREQYMDFLRNRQFRQSLICRNDEPLSRDIKLSKIKALQIRSYLKPTSDPQDLSNRTLMKFAQGKKVVYETSNPLGKAFLIELQKSSPAYIDYSTSLERAKNALNQRFEEADIANFENKFLTDLFQMYCNNFIDLVRYSAPCSLIPSDQPKALSVARAFAQNGLAVPNIQHNSLSLDALSLRLLELLDGENDREAIISKMIDHFQSGVLTISEGGKPLKDQERLRIFLEAKVEQILNFFAANAILVA